MSRTKYFTKGSRDSVARDKNIQRPVLLDDVETFELYEKRSLRSPVGQSIPAQNDPTVQYLNNEGRHHHHDGHIVIEPDDLTPSKPKLPLPWIFGAAISVPVFVIIALFLAVWLQELGIL